MRQLIKFLLIFLPFIGSAQYGTEGAVAAVIASSNDNYTSYKSPDTTICTNKPLSKNATHLKSEYKHLDYRIYSDGKGRYIIADKSKWNSTKVKKYIVLCKK